MVGKLLILLNGLAYHGKNDKRGGSTMERAMSARYVLLFLVMTSSFM